ncbi:MAG: transcriptional regulator, partial [Clostridiales bacterium]|nr:transcriptional regulator [Clostridiales bacterium]
MVSFNDNNDYIDNMITDHIQNALAGNSITDRLFLALIKDKGLQSIMDIGYEMLGRPIYLVD